MEENKNEEARRDRKDLLILDNRFTIKRGVRKERKYTPGRRDENTLQKTLCTQILRSHSVLGSKFNLSFLPSTLRIPPNW